MSQVKIQGNISGTGTFTIASPATNTDRTLTLPDVTGTVVTANASGDVGIGTSSPSSRLEAVGANAIVKSTASSGYGSFYANGATGNAAYYFFAINSTETARIYSDSSNYLAFATGNAGAERMRIDSSGNLLVGKSASSASTTGFEVSSGGVIQAIATANLAARLGRSDTGNVVQFYANTTSVVGSIAVTGSTTAYNTSSDYRLKENIQPMQNALAKVAALKPCTYKWKADGSDGEGFIAHELAEVVPQAVTGEKDAVDAEGKPVYQGIDTSFLVATLTAAIQEQQAMIQSLTQRIATLEGTSNGGTAP